jgi:FkbM family methyltransferase
MWEGVAEKKLMNNIFSKLSFEPSNYNCVDVGANIGNHSILFSNFFKKVTSFEPQKEVFEVLKLNTRKIQNISIINKGLSDIEKKENIKIPFNKRGMGSLVYDFPENSYYNELINLINYDKNFNEEISYIKIDVEGYEIEVIKSMSLNIKKYMPVISFECNPTQSGLIRNNEIFDILKSYGYDNFYVEKEHFIDKLVLGSNIIVRLIRLIFKLLFSSPNNKLQSVNLPINKGYNLITCCSSKSKFQITI